MITVISHRGYWKSAEEKNLSVAFDRSFNLGFGTETDLRDTPRNGKPTIVISHDTPSGHEISLEDVLKKAKQAMQEHGYAPLPLALNIKSDGLAALLKPLLETYEYEDYFIFDMSVPDLIQSAAAGLKCFTRVSEYESEPSLYDHPSVTGVWVDIFKKTWYDAELIRRFINDGKKVALVSPDLHKRMDEFEPFLNWLVSTGLNKESQIILCTDYPEKASEVLLNNHKE